MPTIRVVLAGVRTELPQLPPGYYPAEVDQIEYVAQSKASGQPFLNWRFTLTEGEFKGQKAFFVTSLQQDSLWNLKRTLIELGVDEATLDDEEGVEIDPDQLKGVACTLVVEPDEYQGAYKGSVTRVLPPGAVQSSPAGMLEGDA